MMKLHEWWNSFGASVATPDQLAAEAAQAFAVAVGDGRFPGVRLISLRHWDEMALEGVHLEIDVERPQDLALPIRATEPVAIIFSLSNGQPGVLALRPDFPDTMHQNWTPPEVPLSLCVDDRPWQESKLTTTPADLIRRIQLWLAKAARGQLHDTAQPLDPLFYQNQIQLVIPASTLANEGPPELVGFRREDNKNIIIARPVAPNALFNGKIGFVAITMRGEPQRMARLRHAPNTISSLATELANCGIDLLSGVSENIKKWAGLAQDDLRRVQSRLIIIVAFPVQNENGSAADDLRAFLTDDIAGDIGVKLGVLLRNESGVGNSQAYLPLIVANVPDHATEMRVVPMDVNLAFNRDMATSIAGRPSPDKRRAVLVGAGALGSQLALNLAREGLLEWTIVDQDVLLPHNLARHALFGLDVGAPKAPAVARQIELLLNEPAHNFVGDITAAAESGNAAIRDSLTQADIILDASASVSTSRFLSDFPSSPARRVSTFFNPAGTAVVVLSEGKARALTLRDLEAQYHGLLQANTSLTEHLAVANSGLRYSGSCRSLTNRIPATQAALLSAIAARAVARALDEDNAMIRIWTTSADGTVVLHEQVAAAVERRNLGSWTISYDATVTQKLSEFRAAALPAETGGVLLGITDVSRRSIHIVHALPAPPDSVGTEAGFERGVLGLRADIARAASKSLQQVRYVGEWHSHPRGLSTKPSSIDLDQLAWLTENLDAEGLPAIMAIAADDGQFGIALGSSVSPELKRNLEG